MVLAVPTRYYVTYGPKVGPPRKTSRTNQLATPRSKDKLSTRPRSRRGPEHTLFTLNPSHLGTADCLDLSGREAVQIRFPNSRGVTSRLTYGHHQVDGARQLIPFPGNCTGFLYYYHDQHAAPLERSIRFRVTSNERPSSFGPGQDLLLPSGFPWQIMLLQVARLTEYACIQNQLMDESLITKEQVSHCRTLVLGRHFSSETILFRLTQPFPVTFTSELGLRIVGEKLHRLRFQCFEASLHGKDHYPWAGSAIARFEPSTSPEHAGRRVIFLRIIKIITPVSSNVNEKEQTGRVLKPEEGKLLTLSRRGGTTHPWARDIDESHAAAALRVLWDNSGPW
ncbi:hypothetical protein K438DRAFT_1989843 [Mycena galopus ATCC 62051]|nr:hypothetical protein K438DRAFT_1989843 [Mycena galopus ATCC 62051]